MLPMKIVNNLSVALCFLLLITSCGPSWAPPDEHIEPLTMDYKKEVIQILTRKMNERYVDVEKAAQLESHLNDLMTEGFFDEVDSLKAFKSLIQKEGQALLDDQHFYLKTRKELDKMMARGKDSKGPPENRTEILDDNIALIKISSFVSNASKIKKFMNLANDADACIIDLRNNRGGCPGCVRNVCNYFFDEATHINTLVYRDGEDFTEEESWTEVLSHSKLTDKPVYVLINNNTASAAEEFAYDLQARKRAIIVGSKSRGASNPGSMEQINGNIFVFVSSGRPVNPVTKGNWSKGIQPDIAIDDDLALEKAIAMFKERL